MIPGTMSIRERVIAALVERLQTLRKPTYHFDVRDSVYDVWEAPPNLDGQAPYVLIWQEPEKVGRDQQSDANTGGRYRCILPVSLTFRDKYDEPVTDGSSRHQAYAQRFLADVQLCMKTSLVVPGVPLATNIGTDSGQTTNMPVPLRETGNGLNLEGIEGVIGGEIEYELEYYRCVSNPNLH